VEDVDLETVFFAERGEPIGIPAEHHRLSQLQARRPPVRCANLGELVLQHGDLPIDAVDLLRESGIARFLGQLVLFGSGLLAQGADLRRRLFQHVGLVFGCQPRDRFASRLIAIGIDGTHAARIVDENHNVGPALPLEHDLRLQDQPGCGDSNRRQGH
jgi:hypothetical protein